MGTIIDYKRAYEIALAELLDSGMAGPYLVKKVEAKVAKEATTDEYVE